MSSILTRSGATSRRPGQLFLEPLENRWLLAGGVIALPLVPQFGDPANITRGPDGNMWFTEDRFTFQGGVSCFLFDHVGRITPGGQLTEFPIPATCSAADQPVITAGPDGNLWFTELAPSKLARITPSGVVTEFQTPTANAHLVAITAGPDGNVWFTEQSTNAGTSQSRIARITPQGVITEFLLADYTGQVPSITTGPDGNLWFTGPAANRIGRITPSGVVTEFPLPADIVAPSFITAGPDGNLWFTGENGTVNRLTTQGQVTEFHLPPATPAETEQGLSTQASAGSITSGPDGNLWFAEVDAGFVSQIGRITPSGIITQFLVPTDQGLAFSITAGSDGDLWFLNDQLVPQEPLFGKFVLTVSGSPNQKWVTQAYLDLLHRNVDPGGLAFWSSKLDQGVSRAQVALAIENSQEFRTDVVTLLYVQILDRYPDPSGLSVYTNFLAQGGTQEQVRAMLFGAAEYFGGFAGNSNDQFLSTLYQKLLHRDMDPSGMQSWSQQLNSGASRTAVALGILQSLESDHDEVQDLYHQYLHRLADPTGLSAFSNALQQGMPNELAVALILGSDEYFQQAVS